MTISKDQIIADLEQHIVECWRMVDYVNLLYEQVALDNDLHKDQDKLTKALIGLIQASGALLGVCTIYEMKFNKDQLDEQGIWKTLKA
jgi:hypothetical protein